MTGETGAHFANAPYGDVMEAIGDVYGPHMQAFLERVRTACHQAGMASKPGLYDMPDFYRWDLIVWRPGESGDKRSIAISIEIDEERPEFEEDESKSSPWGIAFRLAVHGWGGRYIGEFAPGNFTEDWWTDARDSPAVGTRWAGFQGMNLDSIPEFLAENE